jgi:hypothetical protein
MDGRRASVLNSLLDGSGWFTRDGLRAMIARIYSIRCLPFGEILRAIDGIFAIGFASKVLKS